MKRARVFRHDRKKKLEEGPCFPFFFTAGCIFFFVFRGVWDFFNTYTRKISRVFLRQQEGPSIFFLLVMTDNPANFHFPNLRFLGVKLNFLNRVSQTSTHCSNTLTGVFSFGLVQLAERNKLSRRSLFADTMIWTCLALNFSTL